MFDRLGKRVLLLIGDIGGEIESWYLRGSRGRAQEDLRLLDILWVSV